MGWASPIHDLGEPWSIDRGESLLHSMNGHEDVGFELVFEESNCWLRAVYGSHWLTSYSLEVFFLEVSLVEMKALMKFVHWQHLSEL